MKTTSPVTILTRVSFKSDARKVVYQALSSDGVTKYNVFLFAGKASSCECPSRKPCRHMKAAESREAERQAQAAVEDDFSDLIEHSPAEEIAAIVEDWDEPSGVGELKSLGERGTLNIGGAFSILR